MELLIATSNPGKVREYQMLLQGMDVMLVSLADVDLGDMDVEEDGTTLEANASIKARAYVQASGLVTLADDTGLFVDALGGAPGVYPARYGGPDLTMQQRRQKLLGELGNSENRSARFECVIALAQPNSEKVQTAKGVCPGHIALEETEGDSGFGYDSIFIAEGYDATWSRIPLAEKNRISHRGQAVQKVVPLLQALLGQS